ncbi:MAG: hypothetical protein ACR2PN_06085 [Luminiphilus sp.]|jgi:hypothetical protein
MRPSHSNLSVPVLIPVQWTSTTQSVLWGSGNWTGRKAIFPGCSKTTAVDIAPMAALSYFFSFLAYFFTAKHRFRALWRWYNHTVSVN